MTGKPVSGASYGGTGALTELVVGSIFPVHVFTAKFTTTGNTPAVPTPAGITYVTLQTPTAGSPTAATVIAQGSNDGLTWQPLPSGPVVGAQVYAQVRLSCTALSGGTSPAIYVTAVAFS